MQKTVYLQQESPDSVCHLLGLLQFISKKGDSFHCQKACVSQQWIDGFV